MSFHRMKWLITAATSNTISAEAGGGVIEKQTRTDENRKQIVIKLSHLC